MLDNISLSILISLAVVSVALGVVDHAPSIVVFFFSFCHTYSSQNLYHPPHAAQDVFSEVGPTIAAVKYLNQAVKSSLMWLYPSKA